MPVDYKPDVTARPMASVMPKGVQWIKAAVSAFQPENNEVTLDTGRTIGYRALVVAPGNCLDWDAIPGLRETSGSAHRHPAARSDTGEHPWRSRCAATGLARSQTVRRRAGSCAASRVKTCAW